MRKPRHARSHARAGSGCSHRRGMPWDGSRGRTSREKLDTRIVGQLAPERPAGGLHARPLHGHVDRRLDHVTRGAVWWTCFTGTAGCWMARWNAGTRLFSRTDTASAICPHQPQQGLSYTALLKLGPWGIRHSGLRAYWAEP